MPIIATAGHVDHGKSTLVQALTGRDPDRWAEEKERGLTIDLGFGWAEIGDAPVGFVDVPGHERFIKNMLAGVGGLDVALLVVAADEGWMPQTEEHLAVLDLLDVRHGVVAVTRIDITEPDVIELAQLEIDEQLAGTSLEGSPLVPVSAVTGAGMEDLQAALAAALADAGQPRDIARPRLWVDRSFIVAGAGVIVTGTLIDGTFDVGQTVELSPGHQTARIRSLQSHENDVPRAQPGWRVAANLSGLERTDVARGALLSKPGTVGESTRFLASARPVRGVEEITDRGAYQLHAGSGAWPVRVRSIDSATLIITASAPIPLACGDRFVLRETGRRAVVGGGRILDPKPAAGSASRLASLAGSLRDKLDGSPDDLATALLAARGITSIADLELATRGGVPHGALIAGGQAMDPGRAASIGEAVAASVARFHEANPLRPGVPKATLASSQGLDLQMLDALLEGIGSLQDDGSTVRAAGQGASWSDADEAAWESAAKALRAAGMAAPRAGTLGLRPEVLHAAIREGRLTKIAEDLVYLPESIELMQAHMADLPDRFTVADFRDAMGISRRQAIPLLEWLDNAGVTSRRGDLRTLRPFRPR